MNAAQLKFMHGEELIGKKILTERVGEWPGGVAIIIEITPDQFAPEIVFQVRHTTAIDDETGQLWEIGVFEWEEVMRL